jgi:acyl dehydratase
MASNAEKALELIQGKVGQEEGVGDWFEVSQDRINAFADNTEDHQFIHVDPEKCAELSPWKVPIAHGFLTLSMLTHLDGSIAKDAAMFEGVLMGVNYGFDKVRFISPVTVGSKIRARSEIVSATPKGGNTIQLKRKMTVEIEGQDKPACVAEWLTNLVYG